MVELLQASGRAVLGVDVVANERSDELASRSEVDFEVADLRDRTRVGDLLGDVSHVIHLAAVRSRSSDANPRLSHEVNVDATYDLIAESARQGVQRFVFGSSHTVYGAFPDRERYPFRETETGATGQGLSLYAATKLAAEAYLEAFAGSEGLDYLSLRLGTIYGPRVSEGSNNATMIDVMRAVDDGVAPTVPWTRQSRHGMVHVDDVALACVRALDCDEVNLAVNVVGESVTAEAIYTTLVGQYGGDPEDLVFHETRARYQAADRTRLQRVLGLGDGVPLADGIKSVVDWYSASR